MKKFFKEFKDFISRGNVLDMAVGIIIGGAFTAIITALVNNILKPLLAMIPGTGDTGALQVVLRRVEDPATGAIDLTKSVILDFGAVISAIITFLLTALVLFLIIKSINSVRNAGKKAKEKALAGKKKGEAAAEVAEETPVEAAPAAPVETAEDVLKEIRDLLKAQNVDLNKQDK